MRHKAETPSREELDVLSNLYFEGRFAEGVALAEQLIARFPQHDAGWKAISVFYLCQNQKAEALTFAKKALDRFPDDMETHNTLGIALSNLNRSVEAELCFRRAMKINAHYGEVHYNLGSVLSSQGRHIEAEASYRQALQLKSNYAVAQYELANTLLELDRIHEAEAHCRQALLLNPDLTEAHNSLGVILWKLGRYAEAEACYRLILNANPDYPRVMWNFSLLLLGLGRYAEAWPLHEARYHPNHKKPVARIPDLPFAQWRGEPLAGKSFLIWPEQGFGDYIQFIRYASLLKNAGVKKLTLLCDPPLIALFEGIATVDAVLPNVGAIGHHDYWSFPLSLPQYFGTTLDTIPGPIPYIKAPEARLDRWREHLPQSGAKIGLVWKGNPQHSNDSRRSLPSLGTLARLWELPGICFISLQKNIVNSGTEGKEFIPQPLIDLGSHMEDFADAAAIVAQLDLVICVDTAIAHLAGALGKPCWLLLPYHADWRWLQNRADSPWYPGNMRLFRQSTLGDWSKPVQDIFNELARALRVPDFDHHTKEPSADDLERLLTFFTAGQRAEAMHLATRLTQEFPTHPTAWKALGALFGMAGRIDEALIVGQKSVAISPDDPEAHHNLALTLKKLGKLTEAEASYRRTLQIKPDYIEAYYGLAGILKDLKQYTEVETVYRQALQAAPNRADAHYNLAIALAEMGLQEAAIGSYQRALEIHPDYVEALNNLGSMLMQMDRFDESAIYLQRALQIDPDSIVTYYNLGNTLKRLDRLEESVASFQQALQRNPEYIDAYNNMGLVLSDLGRCDEAKVCYRRALQLNPDIVESTFNLSLLLLSEGQYAEAWPLHESRYDPRHKKALTRLPTLPYPQWQREPLLGKSLLIWPEQGYGDYIQFARYAPLLKARGLSRLSMLCAEPLKTLLESMPAVDTVLTDVDAIPPHDFWAFPLSLPVYFDTSLHTIPATLPYLAALKNRQEQWRSRLPSVGYKVGLAWKGSVLHRNDFRRSLPDLATLAPLWTIPGISFFSLQKGSDEDIANNPPIDQPLVALGTEITDLADTAAIVTQLDLVICVDTAIAHLAGALGKPCWVLLAYGADWRWLRGRTDSPWYPDSLRLFRQSRRGDWSTPINEIVVALKEKHDSMNRLELIS